MFPSHRRMDRIDHALRWTIQIASVFLFLTLPDLYQFSHSVVAQQEGPGEDFFLACSGGETAVVKKFLQEHPNWANAFTTNGETCLHLTGIYGHSSITKILLEEGADPNIRSTYEKGLRMHPLSWNVYGGHMDNIRLLLEHGANINLDFDSMKGDDLAVTSLDVLLELLKNEPGDERFVAMQTLFEEHGAKTINQLHEGNPEL